MFYTRKHEKRPKFYVQRFFFLLCCRLNWYWKASCVKLTPCAHISLWFQIDNVWETMRIYKKIWMKNCLICLFWFYFRMSWNSPDIKGLSQLKYANSRMSNDWNCSVFAFYAFYDYVQHTINQSEISEWILDERRTVDQIQLFVLLSCTDGNNSWQTMLIIVNVATNVG